MIKRFILILLVFSTSQEVIVAQNQSKLKKLFNKGNDFLKKENYQEAYITFKEYETNKNDNFNVKYKIGFCLLETELNMEEAAAVLKEATENISNTYMDKFSENKAPVKSLYLYASVLHINGKYTEAIEYYQKYYAQENGKDTSLKPISLFQIAKCEFAIVAENKSSDIKVINLKSPINSQFTDHSPIITEDALQLYFTSQRKESTGNTKNVDGNYFEKELDWSNVKKLSPIINSPRNESALCIVNETKEMFVFIDGNIYVSKFINDDWSIPILLKGDVNSKYDESHAFVTKDGKWMYYVSNRPGGFGGKDIYLCQRQIDGSWNNSQNLGLTINTKGDEETPFIFYNSENEPYLYFSSTGHLGMGGFDIFVSKQGMENNWSIPANLGCPINSAADDISFVMLKNAKNSFLTSNRKGGIGSFDIYKVDYNFSNNEYYNDNNNKNYNTFNVKGKIYNNNLKPNQAKIAAVSKDFKFQKVLHTDTSGQYSIDLPKGNIYEITVFGDNVKTTTFNLDESESNLDKKDIILGLDNNVTTSVVTNTITPNNKDLSVNFKSKGLKFEQKIVVPSLFEISKTSFKKELTEDLDLVVDFIKKHPEYNLIINGHADITGNENLNYQLSQQRAKNIYEYFIKSGVDASNIKFNGIGSELPAFSNKTTSGRMNNRRVDILFEKK